MRTIKNIKQISTIGTVLFLGLLFIQALPQDESCRKEVKGIYTNMERLSAPKNGEVYYCNLEVITTPAKGTEQYQKPVTSVVELIVSNKQSHYLSKELSIYEDQKDVFKVMPQQKKIYWSDAIKNEHKQKRHKQLGFLQDTLFDMCSQVSCEKLKVEKDGYDKITVLKPNEKAKEKWHITQLDFYTLASKKQLKKIVIHYSASAKYEKVEMIYHRIDFNYTKSDQTKSVRNRFLNGKEKLIAPYQDYTLVDVRKKQ